MAEPGAFELRVQRLEEGRALFNRGEYYEAHEAWEEIWDDADDPERTWLQGMIQIATGLHKLSQRRADVASRLILRGLDKLLGAPERLDGSTLDVVTLRAAAQRVADSLAAGQQPPPVPPI